MRGPPCAPVSIPKRNGPWPFTISSIAGIPPSIRMGISMGNFAAESAEWACCVCPEIHVTMAARTSNGLKSRKNRRIAYSMVVRMRRRRPSILSGRRELFQRKGDFQIAHGGLEIAAPC